MIIKIKDFLNNNKAFYSLGFAQLSNVMINAVFWLFLTSYLSKEEYKNLKE